MIICSLLPEIARPDADTVLVSEWKVGKPERQRALVEAFVAAWDSAPWPQGLLSVNLFLSNDGETVLNYAQWTGENAYHEFASTLRQSRVEQIDRAVPGIERSGPVSYRLYRSAVRPDPPMTGCVVIVSIEFDGPDEQRQKRWIDAVFEALEAEAAPHPGGISGHFHLSSDGARVLNYAEWTSEEAHREALERSGQGTIGPGPKWREVRSFPGMKGSDYRRYRFAMSLNQDE
jgi:Antibiotic biosynthesis monooxygenase